jgi:adenylate cyclase class 2
MAKVGLFDNAANGGSGADWKRQDEGGMRFEVEQKFRLQQPAAIEADRRFAGVRFSAPIRQTDHYFNHPVRDFAMTDEAFRIRQVGERNYVTYKGPKIDPVTKTRQEVELELPVGQQVGSQYRQLFELLGFQFVATVVKQRRTASIAYEGLPFDVALDEVEGLGHYLELETVATDAGLDRARAAIQALAQHMGLDEVERRSYLELLLDAPSRK